MCKIWKWFNVRKQMQVICLKTEIHFSDWPTWRTITLFYNTFITVLYMFRATSCSSPGGQIVFIQHLVWSLSVSGRSCALDGHLQRVTIPDAVIIIIIIMFMNVDVFPVPWSSRCSWSLHFFLGRRYVPSSLWFIL